MSQEEGNGNAEGSRSSGSTGRKRRSRLSTASTAIMNPNSTETYQANASSSSNNPALSGSEPNGYPMREEDTRRATRMLAQFRNGFRRSVLATEQGLPKPNDGTSEQEAMGMTTERGEEIQAPMNSTQIPDDVMRQDKKRRRIGEYAGPDDAMETDVGVSSVDPNEATSTTNSVQKPPTPPLVSPGVVPLTDSDPLLDDRLRTVEAIRAVLGDDVARRLPSVESLRELGRSQTVVEDASEEIASTPVDTVASVQADSRERRPSRISLPPSTVELLDRLDRSSQNSGAEESSMVTPPASVSITDSSTGPSTLREERRARRTSIRNFTNRLSGWLGVGPSRSDVMRNGARPGDSSPSEPLAATRASLPEPDTSADRAEDPAQEGTPATPSRLATGAVMIVQGFVQTTIPVRERRRRTAVTSASDEERSQPVASTSRIAPRRTMSQPGSSSIAPSITPSQLSNDLTSPQNRTHMQAQDAMSAASAVDNSSTQSEAYPNIAGQAIGLGEVVAADTSHRAADAMGEDPISVPSFSAESSLPSEAPSFLSNPSSDTIRSSSRSTSRAQRQGAPSDSASSARPAAADTRSEPPSFAEQARMLGGLLSVATAATATSLLSHGNQAVTPTEASTDSGSSQSRVTGPRAALEALRNRLRASGRSTGSTRDGRETEDSGNAAANRGVEDVLREYMRHAMASSRNASRLSDADGSDRPSPLSTLLPTSDPASFEAFLNDMQTSLIEALSAFVDESDVEVDRGDHASNTADEGTSPAPIAMERTGADAEAAPSATPAIPVGEPAQPRRLNFFRLFQFPPRRNAPENPSDPAVDLIPVVIVGVRSMNGDINSLTAQNVAAAPFPFNPTDDIQGPAPAHEGEADPAMGQPNEAAHQPRSDAPQRAQSPDAQRASGSWGSRAMRSINRLRRPRSAATNTEATEADEAFTRNYVLWVVGGNYPAGHPILTIPHLFTGELSHEDLWILAEALGQAKPPVATKTDIANSGLAIIKSHQVRGEGDAGAILASSVDQCLICLGDYEDEGEIDVRVMKCKHAYHKDCIDHWLEVGRNSCPACRQAGVERASDRPPEPASAETAGSGPDEDINMTA